jgi:Flp pilus assembly protein TadG
VNCLPHSLRRQRPTADRRGTTLVEFAVVAPVFFLFVLGLIEFGQAMMVQTLITSAAQQGARAGALNGAQASDVTASVNSYLANAGISGATSTPTPNPPSNANPGTDIRVTVTIPYTSVSLLPTPRFLRTTTLSATALVQRETEQ